MVRKTSATLRSWHGWTYCKISQFDVWFNGYIFNVSKTNFLNQGIDLLNRDSALDGDFDNWIDGAQGHFSFVILKDSKLLCGVDKVRTIPLFYAVTDIEVIVGNYADDIDKTIGVSKKKYNHQAALEIAMSGYTIGKKTIHLQISQLCAGELLIVRDDKVDIRKYYNYSPWKAKGKSKTLLKKELTEVSRAVLEDVVENAKGRQLVIPLSAGNDSRFIASGLKELQVKNVFCFSYGINNNFEVKTAEKVAKHLGYPWAYIPLSVAIQKKIFSEDSFGDFWNFTDTLSNAPVLIDYSAIKILKESRKISKEAIFINGNSGDFITGGHIISDSKSIDRLISSVVKKHYNLWSCLKTIDNVENIQEELREEILKLMNYYSLTESNFSEISENIEWNGRQSKIVTATQRSYEFHGYEWRLPFWSPIYMDFWERVEKKYKINQSLYIETLLENNWGGVWGDITVNDFSIASNKLRLFRDLIRMFFIFFGRDAWHKFDKKYFNYFIDNTAATAISPYSEVFFNKCGARNRNSWITKKYLSKHNINFKI